MKNKTHLFNHRFIFQAPPEGAKPLDAAEAAASQEKVKRLKEQLDKTGADAIDARKQISLDIVAESEKLGDESSREIGMKEIQKYCEAKQAEVKKKYEPIYLRLVELKTDGILNRIFDGIIYNPTSQPVTNNEIEIATKDYLKEEDSEKQKTKEAQLLKVIKKVTKADNDIKDLKLSESDFKLILAFAKNRYQDYGDEPKERDLNDAFALTLDQYNSDKQRELIRYSPEVVLSEIAFGHFETLPEDEQKLITEALEFQKTAIEKYRDKKDEKSNPDLYIKDSDIQKLQALKSNLKNDYAQEAVAAKSWDYSDFDEHYYHQLYDDSVADYNPGKPAERMAAREKNLLFLSERGAKLDNLGRAKIYVDLANSLLHQKIRERNPELAEKLLLKAIEILERIKIKEPQKTFYDGNLPLTLSYAYNRYAKLLEEKTKKVKKDPDQNILNTYEKAFATGNLTENNFDYTKTTFEDYLGYIRKFPNWLERAVTIIDKFDKTTDTDWTKTDWTNPFGRWDHQRHAYANATPKSLVLACLYQEIGNLIDKYNYADEGEDTTKIVAKHGELAEKFTALIKKWNITSPEVEEGNLTIEEILKFVNKDITKDESIGTYFDPDVREEMVRRFEASDYSYSSSLPQTAYGRKILQGHLLDTWAPPGERDQERALKYFKEAVKMGDGKKSYDPSYYSIHTALERIAAITNNPERYSGAYLLDGTIGDPIYGLGPKDILDDPKENLEIIYFNPKNNSGIAINRHIDPQLGNALWQKLPFTDSYSAVRGEIQKLRKELAKATKEFRAFTYVPSEEGAPPQGKDMERRNALEGRVDQLETEIEEKKSQAEKLKNELTPENDYGKGHGPIVYFYRQEDGSIKVSSRKDIDPKLVYGQGFKDLQGFDPLYEEALIGDDDQPVKVNDNGKII